MSLGYLSLEADEQRCYALLASVAPERIHRLTKEAEARARTFIEAGPSSTRPSPMKTPLACGFDSVYQDVIRGYL